MEFGMAMYHRKFDKQLYKKVLQQPKDLVNNLATKESRKLYKMHREVMASVHLKKGFMRFDVSKHGILHTKLKTEHNVLDFIIGHFHRRYPVFYIALEYRGKTHVMDLDGNKKVHNKRLKQTIQHLEGKLPLNPLCADMDFDENMWYCYYDSQYIPQRRNISLMKKMMPLKHRQDDCIETFMSKRSKRITDFFV